MQLIIILIIPLFLINVSVRKPANYFRKIDINGKYEIVGRYSIPDEMAKRVNCYRFIYNEKGKLIKVEYLQGGKLHIDSYFGVARIVIEYSDGYEKRVFQDTEGKPMANSDGVYSIRLELNENNCPVSLFNYNKEGELTEDENGVAQYLWTPDRKGQRIKSIFLNKKVIEL